MSLLHRPRIILMIGDDGIIVVPYRIKDAAPFFTPTDGRKGTQEIIEFLARHPHAHVTLVADNLAQDFRRDVLPRLNMFDRAKLIPRRLKQYFPSARLMASLRQKISGKIVMIGVHESNPVITWAERLRARLPAISLLPVEGVRLMKRLMPEAHKGWAMMVSRHKSGGYRQIVTFRNEFVFTRLTPLPDAPNGDAETIARDIKASLDYLGRHGLQQSKDLAVLILLPEEVCDSDAFHDLAIGPLRFQAPFTAATTLGLPFAPEAGDKSADLLFAADILAQARPALSLRLPACAREWQSLLLRQWGLRLASAGLITALACTAWSGNELIAMIRQTRQEAAMLESAQQELARMQQSALPTTAPLARLRQAVARRRIYGQPVSMPWHGLTELGTGMDEAATLVKLEWKKDSDSADEILNIDLRVAPNANNAGDGEADRAETVAAFNRVTQHIAQAMPDYALTGTVPPYPALPQEAISSAEQSASTPPIGTIMLQRKQP